MKFLKNNSKKKSLYVTLGIIIGTAVGIITSFHATYDYLVLKNKIVHEMKNNSKLTAESLQKNIATLMASYSVNEYENLIRNEIQNRDIFAIIVEDYNMGEILGETSYISGKIRDEKLNILDYDEQDTLQNKQLQETYYSEHYDIQNVQGKKLGKIAIYTTNDSINEELNLTIIHTVINTIIISLLLALALFTSIRFFILKPLSNIVRAISLSDENGIPTQAIPDEGALEISILSNTMNTMIGSIKNSSATLNEHHKYLQSIINGISDPIMVIREDYTVELMNNATRKIAKNMDMVADPAHPKCYEISHHRTTPCDGVEHLCPLKEVMRLKKNITVLHDHGEGTTSHFVELSSSPLFDTNGVCVGIIESARDITAHIKAQDELRKQKSSLHFQASHDALTGLANRVLFDERLEKSIAFSKRNETKMALLFIDLDHFKEINDSLGHKAGDKVLKSVTLRLNEIIRKEDTLARLGGDEFTIIMEGLKDVQDASILAQKILLALTEPIMLNNIEVYIGCSIGISLYPENGVTPQDLLKYADAAMYKAKDEGRNNFQYYSAEMTEQAFERVEMETKLRGGLKNKEFVVYYQPQIDGTNGSLSGMEALVRWQSPSMGLLSPSKFLPIAETTGLLIELDRFVMKSAMTQHAKWHKEGLNPGVLAMNLTVKQLQQKDFLPMLEALIKETHCCVEHIELEVTEGQIMTNPTKAIEILKGISELGVKLAVDDFGTGYSSLSYLKKLPINKLKIDQSFIHGLPEDKKDAALTKSIIALARNLNLSIIAEGVETKEQKEFLVQNGCTSIQGYFYSRPIPADEMQKFLSQAKTLLQSSIIQF